MGRHKKTADIGSFDGDESYGLENEESKESIFDFIEKNVGSTSKEHAYYLFEPWDIEDREEWIYEEATKDGYNLRREDLKHIVGGRKKTFQTGYLFDSGFIATMFASNQSGKSYAACMDVLITLTGELPICFKYDKGFDTGVKRQITVNNVRRFGRYDSLTGEFLDKDERAIESPMWDCGTIKGAGKYPKKKLAPSGSKAWIVTYKQARDESWWPLLKGMIPPRMSDTGRSGGFNNQEHLVYLSNGASIHFITYEQGETRLEAAGTLQEHEKLWMVLFDEEPPSSKYWATVTQRVNIIRLVTTPYKGMSWTHSDIILKSTDNKDINIYHCTKYDCPYHTRQNINRSKQTIKKWEIGARIYGLHTEQSGKPYYEELYEHINIAMNFRQLYDKRTIYPSFVWDSPMDLAFNREKMEIVECEEDSRDMWKIFELPKDTRIYWMSVDTGEGSEEEEDSESTDCSCAQILRMPESVGEGIWPIQVAVLDCTLVTSDFARLAMYGAAAYNNCLIAPEANGKSAGTFLAEVRGWPFIYTMVVTNDLSKKQTERLGFFTSSKNRVHLFDMVGEMMKDNIESPNLGIRHNKTIKEISECIVGKNGRPDHGKRKHNDSLMTLGIGLYVYKMAREQIRNNINHFKKKRVDDDELNVLPRRGMTMIKETRPVLGGKVGMDMRQRKMRGGFFR